MTSGVDNTLDSILIQLGDFGKYQSLMFGLVCFGVILHSGVHVAFVFTAMDLEYRCAVPECDNIKALYDPPWLPNAVPFIDKTPSKCMKYVKGNSTENFANCTKPSDFTMQTERCNSFVYKTEELSILREYDLQCEENLWKLTLVGTINNIGQFVGLFISGIISDKYGRRVVFIMALIFCGICGLLRTLAPTYMWFVVLEFLDAAFGAGSYICGFIIGVELVGPKRRVLTGTLISACYAIGEIFAAGSAWIFKDWRTVIYILYGPPMLLIFYFWIVPESVRWYLSKGEVEKAKKVLRKAAQVNGKTLTEETLNKLVVVNEPVTKNSFFDVFKSRVLVLRLINCIFSWITCAFLFYGLTLNSVALAGNGYLDFILTALVEIPAYFACIHVIDRIGRKWSLSGAFFITGISSVLFIFIPKGFHNASLAMWMLGKFGATIAFTVAYIITSELFPTPLRHSMMGTCSTLGRIGSMIAPQTPLLVRSTTTCQKEETNSIKKKTQAQIWDPLPIIMFVAMATVAGLLSLLFPETLDIKLPDTIEEAINIGKKKETSK